ncbi:MAG TPA: hypothetical protein VM345_08720 [Acidimicrobiales bacterium]|jgi:hypothetical protein|nr:hypothetical protein [Acidimicrobiales bacterium]
MAIVVFLLLAGMLAAEIALFGVEAAGIVGAVLLALCAALLIARPSRNGKRLVDL